MLASILEIGIPGHGHAIVWEQIYVDDTRIKNTFFRLRDVIIPTKKNRVWSTPRIQYISRKPEINFR